MWYIFIALVRIIHFVALGALSVILTVKPIVTNIYILCMTSKHS